MINFEEELKRYQPSATVEQAEDNILSSDVRDVTDIIEDMLSELKGRKAY